MQMHEIPRLKDLLRRYPRLSRFVEQRADAKKFSGRALTVSGIAFLLVLLAFAGLMQDLWASDPIVPTDIRLVNLLAVYRDAEVTRFFLWTGLLGNEETALAVALISSAIFWCWQRRIDIVCLWITLLGTELSVLAVKHLVHRQCPEGSIPFHQECTLSFPSAHAANAIALYGFMVYLLWGRLRDWKYRTGTFLVGSFLIALIGLGKVYLGVHFLSDVLGGYLIGLMWLIAGMTLREWHLHPAKGAREPARAPLRHAKTFSALLIAGGLASYAAYGFAYRPVLNTYTE